MNVSKLVIAFFSGGIIGAFIYEVGLSQWWIPGLIIAIMGLAYAIKD